MIGVLLLIGKIIGILLLSVLLLILIAAGVVLLVPIRYRVSARKQEGPVNGEAEISWLLRLIHICVRFQGTDVSLSLRIAGIDRKKRREKKQSESQKPHGSHENRKRRGKRRKQDASMPQTTSADSANGPALTGQRALPDQSGLAGQQIRSDQQRPAGSLTQSELQAPAKSQAQSEQIRFAKTEAQNQADRILLESVRETEARQPEQSGMEEESGQNPEQTPEGTAGHARETEAEQESEGAVKKAVSRIEVRIRHMIETIRRKARRLRDQFRNLCRKKEALTAFKDWITGEEMWPSVTRTIGLVKKIILHILPQRGQAQLTFGFDDPAVTGQVLGVLAMLYPKFRGNLDVEPCFDRAVLEGSVCVRGRIRLGMLLVLFLRIIKDKNIRTLIGKVRKGGK